LKKTKRRERDLLLDLLIQRVLGPVEAVKSYESYPGNEHILAG